MAFTRQDEQTVVDDESGQSYFMPQSAANVEEQPAQPTPGFDYQEGADLSLVSGAGQPFNGMLPSAVDKDQDAAMLQGLDPNPQEYLAGTIDTPNLGPAKSPTSEATRAAAGTVRSNAISHDPTAFAAAGGVVKSREELAAMQGGIGQEKEQAALLTAEALRTERANKAAKDNQLALFTEQTANEFQAKAEAIDADARQRISGRQKQADELAKKHIDPKGGWNDKGAPAKVMWVLGLLAASQTKNSTQNIGMLMQAADNMLNRDIAAQKANLAKDQEGLNTQTNLDAEAGKLDLKGLSDWSVQRELRYKSLDRMLDAKISAMGNPAAERAGLLKAKNAISEEILKGQAVFQTQVQAEAVDAKNHAQAVYMARLNHQYKIAEQKDSADRADKKYEREMANQEGERGIVTGQASGLVATTKGADGKTIVNEGVVLQARSAKDAKDAQEKTSNGNKVHGLLKIMREEMNHMSDKDVAAQSYTPRFQSTANELGEVIAKINNDKITDRDVINAMGQLVGVSLNGDGAAANVIPALRVKGDTIAGMKGVLDRRLASLPDMVSDQVKQHLDARSAKQYTIAFKPTNLITEGAKGTLSANEEIDQAGGGANVRDLQKPNRPPMDKGGADALIAAATADKTGGTDTAYAKQRDAGKLPRLDQAEEDLVSQARTSFKDSDPNHILKLAQAYRRQIESKGVSDEARFQITMEAREAMKGAQEKLTRAIGEGLYDSKSMAGNVALKQKYESIGDLMASDEWKALKTKHGMAKGD